MAKSLEGADPAIIRGLRDQLGAKVEAVRALRVGPWAGEPVSAPAIILADTEDGVTVKSQGTDWKFRSLGFVGEAQGSPGAALDDWIEKAERRVRRWTRWLNTGV
jgi:hypothetical protein